MTRWTVAAVLALIAVSAAGAQQPVVPNIVMEDQFERTHSVADHRGDVVVLIYGDRASASANKALGERLHVTFHPTARGQPPAQARRAPVRPVPGQAVNARAPDVLTIPVASIGPVPALVRKLLRGQMRSASPEVPVWLDFGDAMKKGFGMKAGVPNVVVLDTAGRFRFATAGVPTLEGIERVVAVIEGLRREASPAR